jgi:hypothetical protein
MFSDFSIRAITLTFNVQKFSPVCCRLLLLQSEESQLRILLKNALFVA